MTFSLKLTIGVVEAMQPHEILRASKEALASCDNTNWHALIRFLVDELRVEFGCDINTNPINEAHVGDAFFCVNIVRAAPSSEDMYYWKGILSASWVDDKLLVSLLAFMYSGEERLVTKTGKEFAEYHYVLNEEGQGRFELLGWFEDEYDEYREFK